SPSGSPTRARRGRSPIWRNSRARCARSGRTRAGRAARPPGSHRSDRMSFVPVYRRASATIVEGPHRAAARAMLKAVGFDDEALRKPIIGVANTWIEIGPCNYHLRELAAHVNAGISEAR